MIKVGDELPQGILRTKTATIHELKTDDMFSGKKIVLFSLPGAFTPTCSSKQLPGYESKYNEFKERGIDEIYCMSVNDSFVMNAWAKNQNIDKIKVIPDGNGAVSYTHLTLPTRCLV